MQGQIQGLVQDPTSQPVHRAQSLHPQLQDPKAMHIETVKVSGETVSHVMSSLYSSMKSIYPDGEKLRFIPSPKYLQNKTQNKTK